MSDLLRILYRPGYDKRPPGNGMPRAHTEAAYATWAELGEHLEAKMMKPLHWEQDRFVAHVNDTLDTITHAERVFLEIERIEGAKAFYTVDYDPLRY